MEGEERKWGPGHLTNLQNELIWALLGSGLSREVLVQALEELEQERVTPGAEKGDRGDGESSEEGEIDFPPPIFQELEALPSEEAARERALVDQLLQAECLQRGVSSSQLAGLGSNLVTEVRVYNWFANRRKEAFRHKLALDTPYTSQSANTTNHTLAHSPVQVMKYSQQIPCDSLGSARGRSGDRGLGGRLASPIQLEPSHTLLETHYHKLVSGGGPLPPVSTLTSLHSLSASPSPPQGLNMASLPSAMSLGEFSLLIGQTVPVINNVGGGFTTLQPISFQQQLTQQFQNHMGHSPFMATMTGLPCHMYSKSSMSPYPPSSLLSQAMVVTDSSSLGTLISLSAVGEILTTDPEEETEQPYVVTTQLIGSTALRRKDIPQMNF